MNHDYTEEYANYYHHEMLKTFATRPYLWSTHVWNMFNFAADARDEGGVVGMNNKGLVTYDRKLKKDAFYLYKAYWTSEPMVYVAGRRFADRAPEERKRCEASCRQSP
jgi:beta-galactosidase